MRKSLEFLSGGNATISVGTVGIVLDKNKHEIKQFM